MSESSPASSKTELGDCDVVLGQKYKKKPGNVLCRARIKELILERDKNFVYGSLDKMGKIIKRALKRDETKEWRYWIRHDAHNEGGSRGYKEASDDEILGWIKTVVGTISQQIRDEALKGTQLDTVVADGEVAGEENSQQGDGGPDDDEDAERERRDHVVDRRYEKGPEGKAWQSLFRSEDDAIYASDIEHLLNIDDPSPGDFSVLESRSWITRKNTKEQQSLAKVIMNLANKAKEIFYWFYDTRDGRFYRATPSTDHASQPFKWMAELLLDCAAGDVSHFRFRRHEDHGRWLSKIMNTAAESANCFLDDSTLGSNKRAKPDSSSLIGQWAGGSLGDFSALSSSLRLSGATSLSASLSQEFNDQESESVSASVLQEFCDS